jgi:CRP/FNR family transcriptional regulator, cyclic AMP receptor protein
MHQLSDIGTTALLRRVPLLSALEPEERLLFTRLLQTRSYAARRTVVWEDERGGALFIVLSGYLKATTAGADGSELLLSIMGPGEVFGELSLLDGQPRSASVSTLQAVELAFIEREPFLQMVEGSPKLAVRLLGVLSQRLRNLSKRCENVACKDVRSRLAQALVFLADRHGRALDGRVEIPVRLSQQDLGSMVGATRESVNKLLRNWSRSGVLSHVSGRVTISNVDVLRSMSAD